MLLCDGHKLRIWEDEDAFLGPFKGVAKEGGTSSGNFSVERFGSQA